jgi:hypothetical protein
MHPPGGERREQRASFASLDSLYRHFSGRLSPAGMNAAVKEAITGFISRDGSDREETFAQLVRKCEATLAREAEKTAISGPPAYFK